MAVALQLTGPSCVAYAATLKGIGARDLRGGGGKLGKIKTLTYGSD